MWPIIDKYQTHIILLTFSYQEYFAEYFPMCNKLALQICSM